MQKKHQKFNTIKDLEKAGKLSLLNSRIENSEKVRHILYEFQIAKLTFKNYLMDKERRDQKFYYTSEELEPKKSYGKATIKVGVKGNINLGKRVLERHKDKLGNALKSGTEWEIDRINEDAKYMFITIRALK